MCNFFSCNSNGCGDLIYFDWELRKKVLTGEIKNYNPDSHTSIADYFKYQGELEDTLNKYEYNPLTRKFTIDQLNTIDDSKIVKEKLDNMDWKTIVEPLIIKPIINPFDIASPEITPEIIELIKKWASVGASFGDSVDDSVWDSVWASAWASVGASVWASVRAYMSSFFRLDYGYDFTPVLKLWEMGLVPSYDGEIWRLHSKNGVVWEGKL